MAAKTTKTKSKGGKSATKSAASKSASKNAVKRSPAKKGRSASKTFALPSDASNSTALIKRPRALTLVTGGTGFLGSHIVRELVAAGARNVRVLSQSAPAWLDELGVENVKGSVTSADDVARAVEGVSEIYHLAGLVSREPNDAHRMYELHVTGTRLLCDAARRAGVKSIVLASTSGTIAVTDSDDVVPDEDWPQPLDIISRWPYYASKVYQERVALEHFSGDGERLVILNPSLLLGPGDERLSSTRVILDFISRKIASTPKGGLSFVDVRDAAQTFIQAMERGRNGERYLLGSANWTFAEFFGRLERISKVAAPRISLPSKLTLGGARALNALYKHWKLSSPVEPTEIEMADYFWYLDSTKARDDLGFSPRDPSATLHDSIAYVRDNFLGGSAFNIA